MTEQIEEIRSQLSFQVEEAHRGERQRLSRLGMKDQDLAASNPTSTSYGSLAPEDDLFSRSAPLVTITPGRDQCEERACLYRERGGVHANKELFIPGKQFRGQCAFLFCHHVPISFSYICNFLRSWLPAILPSQPRDSHPHGLHPRKTKVGRPILELVRITRPWTYPGTPVKSCLHHSMGQASHLPLPPANLHRTPTVDFRVHGTPLLPLPPFQDRTPSWEWHPWS